MSAEVIPLDGRRLPPLADAHTAWLAYVAAKQRTDATLGLADMAAAVRAYEAFLHAFIPDPVERREVWP